MKISACIAGSGCWALCALVPPGRFAIVGHALGGLLLAATVLLSAACREAPKAAARPPEPVKVAPVVQKDVPIYGEWVGTTVGYVTAQIRAQVSGYLVSQNYREGALVKTGDLMFQIDPRPYQSAADQAKAQLQLAESQLEQAKAQVAQAAADVAKAEANQKKTELEVARYTPLAARGSVSQQELDNTVQNNLANLAAVQAAKASLASAQASVAKSQADIARAQAALNEAQLNLGWTKVHSPINGIAGIKKVDIGDLIANNTILTTVSRVDPIYVQFPVSEQEYLRWRARGGSTERDVKKAGDLEITLSDGATYPHRGTADILGLEVGVGTGTMQVRGVFPNPGDLLRPGQYAKVRAVIDLKKGALLIPQRAVRDVQGLHEVGVVGADETVDLRKVQVGDRVGSLWIIGQGLKPGERVIVEGIEKVRAGEKVKPTPAEAEPEGQASQPAGAPPAGAPAGPGAPPGRGPSK
jgi:membrane fusion protein (multidrug efflux system)